MSYTIQKEGQEIEALLNSIGDVTDLHTTAKNNLVSAVNELFTSVSNGKTQLAAAITDMGVETAAGDSFATMAANIRKLTGSAGLVSSVEYSGTYATATYFTESACGVFGCEDGRVALVMKSGTSTTYENLYFTLEDNSGQGIELDGQSVYNYSSAKAGMYYIAVMSGIQSAVKLTVEMNSRSSSLDYVTCAISVTAA